MLLVDLQALDRCGEVDLRFEKLVRTYLVLAFEIYLMVRVDVHLLVDHLRYLLGLQRIHPRGVLLEVILGEVWHHLRWLLE